jgi:hypothetical protein
MVDPLSVAQVLVSIKPHPLPEPGAVQPETRKRRAVSAVAPTPAKRSDEDILFIKPSIGGMAPTLCLRPMLSAAYLGLDGQGLSSQKSTRHHRGRGTPRTHEHALDLYCSAYQRAGATTIPATTPASPRSCPLSRPPTVGARSTSTANSASRVAAWSLGSA